jgi:GntR family transcriptional regulator
MLLPAVTYCPGMVDHEAPVPLYVQLAAIIRKKIQDGELTSRIPSVRTLSQEYEVSHITAAKALQILKDEGIVISVRGKGAYVKGKEGTGSE